MDSVKGSSLSHWIEDLARHSPAAAEIAAFPWAETSLGHPDEWSDHLQAAVRVCLTTSAPMLLVWGPELLRIFNDPYSDLAGEDNLAGSIGMPTRLKWSGSWEQLGPKLVDVQLGASEKSVFQRNFVRTGSAAREERWLEYSCSRVETGFDSDSPDPDTGVLCMVSDVTDQVLTERQLICLRDLATSLLEAKDLTDVCVRATRILSQNPTSLPCAEFHLLEGSDLIRVASTLNRHASPPGEAQMRAAITAGRARILGPGEDVVDIRETLDHSAPRTYIAPLGLERVVGVFVAGLNPAHQDDSVYKAFIELCSKAISVAVDSAARHSEELRTQSRISKTLQEAMLSPASDSPTVAARYVPATGGLVVGGDWYDVIDLGDGRSALTVGDCVGHDLEAAAIMGQLRSASRALLLEGNSPAQVLNAMDLFADVIDGLAATMVCAILDPANSRLTYSSAGHPPGLLIESGNSSWLDRASGTPLGVRKIEREECDTKLGDKDLVLFYSDGLVERRHEPLTCGLERLRTLAVEHWADPVQHFADAILRQMTVGHVGDDIVLVAARTHTS